MERKGGFDYILLETTGLADPGPIAGNFWVNEEYASGEMEVEREGRGKGLGGEMYLDGVVVVVEPQPVVEGAPAGPAAGRAQCSGVGRARACDAAGLQPSPAYASG